MQTYYQLNNFKLCVFKLYSSVRRFYSFIVSLFCRVCLFFFFIPITGLAQAPYITNYSSSNYDAGDVNWSSTQDDDGYIYIANSDGVLVYDGHDWTLVSVAGRTARLVVYDKTHGLLVGTVNDFGKLIRKENGEIYYESFSNLLPTSIESFKTIFNILILNNFVFLEAQDAIYKFDGKSIKNYTFNNYIVGTYIANNILYVIGDTHIYQFEKDSFTEISTSNFHDLGEITLITDTNEGELLVVVDYEKIYKLSNGLNGSYQIWSKSAQELLKNHKLYIYATDSFKHQYRFFTTYNSGVLVFDQAGNPIVTLNTENGLSSNQAQSIFVDIEKNVWISTSKGVDKVNFEIPFKKYDEQSGLSTPVLSVLEHNGAVYAGTNTGVYILSEKENKFIRINTEPSQFWDIIPFNKGVLAAGGNHGLFYIEGETVVANYITEISTMSIAVSLTNPKRIYAGLYDGFLVLDYNNQKRAFELALSVDEIKADIRTIVEDTQNNIWAGTSYSGLFRVKLNHDGNATVNRYTAKDGYFSSDYNHVFGTSRFPVFTSNNHLYKYSIAADSFEVITYPETPTIDSYPNLRFDGKGRIWDLSSKFILDTKDINRSDSTSLNFFKSKLSDLSPDGDNTVWLATRGALYKFDLPFNLPEPPGIIKPVRAQLSANAKPVLIEQVSDQHFRFNLPPHTPAFDLTFSYPTFIQEEQVRFRYLINGFKPSFSDWSKANSFTIAGLPYGKFELVAEAIGGTGLLSKPVYLTIVHTAPWYLRTHYIILNILIVISLIFGFNKIRNYQILKRNEYLEHIVQTRTDEVRTQNDKLKELASEMANANQLKSKMLQMAVHDLRNPLSVLMGYCDILSDEDDIQQQKLVLTSIERVIEKMLNSIEALLSADEKGTIQPNSVKEVLDLRPLVLDVIADNTILANRKKQTLESELEANCYIRGDRYQIVEVFENLINNAIKYAPLQTNIIVRLQIRGLNGNRVVRFSVTDFGPGIKEEDMDRIFTPYARSENNPTAGEASSGLGLSIVKEIVHWHHGKIWVESNQGKSGSTFNVEFPLSK
ncbi:HAMP domain-containing histidine kinase [bacterium]|nr:MAG: HAMP domain-containing histidine kinase [bacterium]